MGWYIVSRTPDTKEFQGAQVKWTIHIQQKYMVHIEQRTYTAWHLPLNFT
jgi:hypothetical protein